MADSSSSKNSTTNKTGTGTTSKVDPIDQTKPIGDTPKLTGGKIYVQVDKPSDKMFSSVLKPLDSVSDGGFAIAYISQGYWNGGGGSGLSDDYWKDSELPDLTGLNSDAGLSEFGQWVQHAETRGLKVHAYAPALDGLKNVLTYEQYIDQKQNGKKVLSVAEETRDLLNGMLDGDSRTSDEDYDFTQFPWKRLPAGAYVFMDGANYTALINAYRVVQHYGFSLGVLIEHPNDGYLATAQSFKSKKDPSLYIMGYSKKKASAADFPKDEFDGYYWQATNKTGDVTAFGGEDFHGLLNRYNEPVPLIPVDPIDSKPAKATKKAYVGLGYDHKLKSGQTLGYSPDGNSKHFKAAVTPWGFTFQEYDAARMWRLLKPYIIESAESMQGRQGNPGKNGVSPTIDKATKHWLLGDIDTGVVAQGIDGQTPSIDPKSHHWVIGGKDTGQSSVGPAGHDGAPGKAGKDGKDGDSPDINEAGNWVIGGRDTGIRAEGMPGADGATPMIDPATKHWMIDGADTGIVAQGIDGKDGKDGRDGVSPVIDPNTKDWTINGEDTGINAQGKDGRNGVDGKNGLNGSRIYGADTATQTSSVQMAGEQPQITVSATFDNLTGLADDETPVSGDYIFTSNVKNADSADTVFLGKITSVVPSSKTLTAVGYNVHGQNGHDGKDGQNGRDGKDGQPGKDGASGKDGLTPSIDPSTKHWMIGTTDTGVTAQGQNGKDGVNGKNGSRIFTAKQSYLVSSTTQNGTIQYTADVDFTDIDRIDGELPAVGDYILTPIINDSKVNHMMFLGKATEILSDQWNVRVTGVNICGTDGKDGKNGTKIWHAANKAITAPIYGSWYTDLEQVSTTNLPTVGDLVITNDGGLSQVISTASTTDGNVLHGSFNTGHVIGNINGQTGKTGQRGSQWWTTTSTKPYTTIGANVSLGLSLYRGMNSQQLGISDMNMANKPGRGDMLLCSNGDVYKVWDYSWNGTSFNLTFLKSGINLKS